MSEAANAFISRWSKASPSERANSQLFLSMNFVLILDLDFRLLLFLVLFLAQQGASLRARRLCRHPQPRRKLRICNFICSVRFHVSFRNGFFTDLLPPAPPERCRQHH